MTKLQTTYRVHSPTKAAWDAMMSACRQATSSICLEQYVLDPDNIGQAFVDIFVDKAKEGVRVQLILDWWGSKTLRHHAMYRQLVDAGVHVLFYRPYSISWIWSKDRFFPRDHRKLVIIDDHTVFVGGVCMYDKITNWQDSMVQVEGACVEQFTHLFSQMQQKITNKEQQVSAHPDFNNDKDYSVYANAPDSNENHLTKTLMKHIAKANTSIELATPYFVPSNQLLAVLMDACKRGVKVDILLSKYSKFAPYAVGKYLAGRLLKAGIRISYYDPCMLHLKAVLVDDRWVAIGSCNLDGLSIYQNQEVMLTSSHPAFIRDIKQLLHTHLSNTTPLTLTQWQTRPFIEKITAPILLIFRKYL